MKASCPLQGKTSTTERPVEPSSNGSSIPKETQALLAEMPAEQQKQLSQLYFFLTQVPALSVFLKIVHIDALYIEIPYSPGRVKASTSLSCCLSLQNPDSRPQFNNINWAMAQRAIADDYQRLIWGPAEILNGRMASESCSPRAWPDILMS